MKVKELLPLIVIISVTLTIGSILIVAKLVPEEAVKNFNPLSQTSSSPKTDFRVIKTPSPGNNTYIYAINQVAEEALHIAQNDTSVKQIINRQKDKALTIAAIQPTILEIKGGKATYNSPVGQIIIASNWQYINGKFYSEAANFNQLINKKGESHQHIWNVFVDLNKRTVTGISEEPERIMRETLKGSIIYTGINMFMPDIVKINTGSSITWPNNSNLPHNIVGTYRKNTTTNTSGSQVTVDSGTVGPNQSWKYNFNDVGVFEYRCTFHSADGMKGTLIVSPS
jgi:plastocyanin